MKNEEEVKEGTLTKSEDLTKKDNKDSLSAASSYDYNDSDSDKDSDIDTDTNTNTDYNKESDLNERLTEFSKDLLKSLDLDPESIRKFLPKDIGDIPSKFSNTNKYLANVLNSLSDVMNRSFGKEDDIDKKEEQEKQGKQEKQEEQERKDPQKEPVFQKDGDLSFLNYNFQEEFSSFLKERYGDSIRIKSASSESTEDFPDIKGYKVELEMKSKNEDGTPFIPPKDLNEEFEKYLKEKFNGRVNVVSIPISEDKVDSLKESIESLKKNVLRPRLIRKKEKLDSDKKEVLDPDVKTLDYKNFHYKPKDIKEYLDRFVINQDEAKKALAIAVCDHYNHVRECQENPDHLEKDYAKQNILILGPTEVGKTYLVRQIAKLIGVPFVKADATRFSETGYVGANVDDLISDLVQQAGGDVDVAKYGIVYLDEADKLAARTNLGGKDISGRGVQFGLLKLMEDTDVDLSSSHDMRSQLQSFMEFQKTGKIGKKLINTRHILFIISGSFNYLADIIKNRLNQNSIGFMNDLYSFKDKDQYFEYATTADFIEFGFEPEFVGRLPVRVSCRNLSIDDLYSILKNSEGSIIRQYIQAFKNYGIDIIFKDEALKIIAERAFEEKTGARALMTICEKIFRDFKYELPSTSVKELKVDKDLVLDPAKALEKILSKARRTSRKKVKKEE